MSTKIQQYLKETSDSVLLSGEPAGRQEAIDHMTQGASTLFVLAARYLVEDGVEEEHVAHFLVEAAIETLSGGLHAPLEDQKLARERLVMMLYSMTDYIDHILEPAKKAN